MRQKLILVLYSLVVILLVSCEVPKNKLTPTPAPTSSVLEILDELRRPGVENLDIYLCPSRHTDVFPSGQTVGWVLTRTEKLKKLGVYVRWDCKTQAFEITTEEDQKSRCDCP